MPRLSKEMIQARIAALSQEHQVVLSRLNFVTGAIQESNRWLIELEKKEPKKEPEETPSS